MILHFVTDEKVTDQIIENFGKVDSNCFFLVFNSQKNKPFQYIKSIDKKLITLDEYNNDINYLINKLNVSAIFTHAFHLEYAKIIQKIKSVIKIAWYPWGFDVYGLPKIKPLTYAPLNNQFLLDTIPNLRVGRVVLKNEFLRKLFFLFKGEDDRYSIIYKALKKVDFFVTYLEEDYSYYSSKYPNNFKYVSCPFSTIDQYLANTLDASINNNAEHILIGNSNTEESNHLDVLEALSKYKEEQNTESYLVYTPLSYGDNLKYRNKVIERGEEIFAKDFVPLLTFMDRKAYIDILKSCSVGIFYHYRQQAMGNIIAMLYLGCRVYLSTNNPAFSFFTKHKIRVYDFEKDFKIYKNTRLSSNEITHNRAMLNNIFNQERVLSDIKKLTLLID